MIAHKDNSRVESLDDHSGLTLEKFQQESNIKEYFDKIFKYLNVDSEFLWQQVKHTVYMHDAGKINEEFQNKITGKNYDNFLSNHSKLSSLIYLDKLDIDQVKTKDEALIVLINAYIIEKHHSKLISLDELYKIGVDLDLEEDFFKKYILNWEGLQEKTLFLKKTMQIPKDTQKSIVVNIYSRLLMYSLKKADIFATTQFMENHEINYNTTSTAGLLKDYQTSNDYLRTQVEAKEDINQFRNDFFNKVSKKIIDSDENIFVINAPTGASKSNTALFSALSLAEKYHKKNILFAYPLNTLIEQNREILANIFSDENKERIQVFNSITAITDKENIENYSEIYLEYMIKNSDISVTSYVQVFNILFGNDMKNILGLGSLINSVLVLDEIQLIEYPHANELVNYLRIFLDIFDSKMIITSATSHVFKGVDFINCTKEDYPFIKKMAYRYKMNYLNIDSIDSLVKEIEINKGKKILVEVLFKKTANELYSELKNKGLNVFIMTSETSVKERNQIIEEFNSNPDVILTGTQVVEAGLDIDADIGFKNDSTFFSNLQFAGRVNRNNKKKDSNVYIFEIDKPEVIYNSSFYMRYSLRSKNNWDLLQESDVNSYQEKVKEELKKYYSRFKIDFSNYSEVNKLMKLITQDKTEYRYISMIDKHVESSYDWIGSGILKDLYYNSLEKISKCSFSEQKIKYSQLYSWLNEYIVRYEKLLSEEEMDKEKVILIK